MKKALTFLRWALLYIGIIAFHIAVVSTVPFPWNKIQVMYVLLVAIMVLTQRGSVVWAGFFLFSILELYSLTPYGLQLFAGTISLLLLYWLLKTVLTTITPVALLVGTGVGLVIFRVIFSVLAWVIALFGAEALVFNSQLMTLFAWELSLSCLVAAFLYAPLHVKLKYSKQRIS